MTIVEFRESDLPERHQYLFDAKNNVSFKGLRDDSEFKYSLWDCGDFYAEMKVLRTHPEIVSIDAWGLNDDRINLYIEFYKENWDKEYLLNQQ